MIFCALATGKVRVRVYNRGVFLKRRGLQPAHLRRDAQRYPRCSVSTRMSGVQDLSLRVQRAWRLKTEVVLTCW